MINEDVKVFLPMTNYKKTPKFEDILVKKGANEILKNEKYF